MTIRRSYIAVAFGALLAAVIALALIKSSAGPAASGKASVGVGSQPIPVPINPELKQTGTVALYLVGRQNGRAFYRATKNDGRQCLGAGDAGQIGEVGFLYCSHGDLLTSTNSPIAVPDVEATAANPGDWKIIRVDGFALDGVTRVELTDPSGAVVAQAPVVDNVFAIQPPAPVSPGVVTGFDAAGTIIASHSFEPTNGR